MKKFKIAKIDIIKHDKVVEPHVMVNPETGEQVEVRMQSEHDEYTESGYVMANQGPQQQQQAPQQGAPQQASYQNGGVDKEFDHGYMPIYNISDDGQMSGTGNQGFMFRKKEKLVWPEFQAGTKNAPTASFNTGGTHNAPKPTCLEKAKALGLTGTAQLKYIEKCKSEGNPEVPSGGNPATSFKIGGTSNGDSTIGITANNGRRKYEDGGVDKYDRLTGQYIEEVPSRLLHKADAEVEVNEFLKFTNGEIREAVGETHENGGIALDLPEGTQILSDNLTIGKSVAKELKKEHSINVKASDPYAEVLSKYTKKLGLDELNDMEAELFKTLEKEDKTLDKKTQTVNTEYINSKILAIENKKKALEEEKTVMFDKLFTIQESTKPQTEPSREEFTYGGVSEAKIREIAENNGITMDKAIFLLGGTKTKKGYYSNGGDEGDVSNVDEAKKAIRKRPYAESQRYEKEGIDRLNVLRARVNLKPIPYNSSKSDIRAAAGEMQTATKKTSPELTSDYMQNTSTRPTNKLIGIMKKQGIKVEGMSDAELNTALKEGVNSGKITTSQVNEGFDDNKWDYRGIETGKKEVSEEELKKIKETDRALTVGDNTYYIDPNNPGKYMEYTTKAAEVVDDVVDDVVVAEDDPTDNIKTSVKPIQKRGGRGFIFPDQSLLPPNPMEAHQLFTARRGRLDPVKVGVEDQLTEINRQGMFAQEQLKGLPASQRAAATAMILASTAGAGATAIGNKNRINAKQQQSVDLFNINQADAENQLNNSYGRDFEFRQLTAKAKTDKDLRDYYEFNRNVGLNNYYNQQTLNMMDVTSPDFELDIFGNAINYTPSYNNQVGEGSDLT